MASSAAFRSPSLSILFELSLFLILCFSPGCLQVSVDTCLTVDGYYDNQNRCEQAGNTLPVEETYLLIDGDEGKGLSKDEFLYKYAQTETSVLSQARPRPLQTTKVFEQEGEQANNRLESHDLVKDEFVRMFSLLGMVSALWGLWTFCRWISSFVFRINQPEKSPQRERTRREIPNNQRDELEEVAAPLGRIIALLMSKGYQMESVQLSSSEYFKAEEISQVLRAMSISSLSPVLGDISSSEFSSNLASSFQEIYCAQTSLRRLKLSKVSSDNAPLNSPDRQIESHEAESRKRKGSSVGKRHIFENTEPPALRRCSKLETGDTSSRVETVNRSEKIEVSKKVNVDSEEDDTGRTVDCKEWPGAPFVSDWETVSVEEKDGVEGNPGVFVHSESIHVHKARTEPIITSEDNENDFWRGQSCQENGSLGEVKDCREIETMTALAPLMGGHMLSRAREGFDLMSSLMFQRFVSAFEDRNHLDARNLQLATERLNVKMKLHSEMIEVKKSKVAEVAKSNDLRETKLKMTRAAEVEKRIYENCISYLVTGQILTIFGTCVAMGSFGYNSLFETCKLFKPENKKTNWWRPWSFSDLFSSFDAFSRRSFCNIFVCCCLVAGFVLMFFLSWGIHKASQFRNRYFFLVVIFEISLAGYLGSYSVDMSGGNGRIWFLYWVTLVLLSAFGATFPAKLFTFLKGYSPEEAEPPQGKSRLWPSSRIRVFLFGLITIFVLPLGASLIPFYSQVQVFLTSKDWIAKVGDSFGFFSYQRL